MSFHGKPPTHLKMKSPPHWKVMPFSRKQYLEKSPEILEIAINTCASIIKQHWKMIAEIPQERDFLTCNIQNLVRKVKQFLRKCYITWIITFFVAINISPLMVLFFYCQFTDL